MFAVDDMHARSTYWQRQNAHGCARMWSIDKDRCGLGKAEVVFKEIVMHLAAGSLHNRAGIYFWKLSGYRAANGTNLVRGRRHPGLDCFVSKEAATLATCW
jgi:hypothetical protein